MATLGTGGLAHAAGNLRGMLGATLFTFAGISSLTPKSVPWAFSLLSFGFTALPAVLQSFDTRDNLTSREFPRPGEEYLSWL